MPLDDWAVGALAAYHSCGGGFLSVQTPYSQLEEAFRTQDWQNPAMKSLLTAGIVFLLGAALLAIIPDADIVPTGVRAVLNEVDSIW